MSSYFSADWRIAPDGYLTIHDRFTAIVLTPEQAELLARDLRQHQPSDLGEDEPTPPYSRKTQGVGQC